jgi:hypothetical protein
VTPQSELALAWSARLRAVYGEDLGRGAPVVHVAAVASAPGGHLPVLATGSGAPATATDAFALEAARARVDAIVTTGEILRREAKLSHELSRESAAWRREVLGSDRPALVVVLTRRPEEAVSHLALASGPRVVLTPSTRPATSSMAGIRVLERRFDSLAGALALLANECAARSISVEAGPHSARELYRPSPLVDELLLSIYEGPPLAPAASAGEFATAAEIGAVFGAPVHEHVEAAGGIPWRFRRYLRSSSPGT